MSRTQTILFSILHGVAVLLLPALIFLLTSCLDANLVNQPGPEVPCADIEKALNSALPGPWTFDIGQFVQIESTAAPVDQPADVVQEVEELVVTATPSPTAGETSIEVEETVSQNGTKNTTEASGDAPAPFFSCGAQPSGSFHNFSSTATTFSAPRDSSTGACDSRYTNCLINATTFSFDELVDNNGTTVPAHYVITVSNDVPYLARNLQFCLTYSVDANGEQIPVTKCDTVINFLFSSN